MKKYIPLLFILLVIMPIQTRAETIPPDCLKNKIAFFFEQQKMLQSAPLANIKSYPEATQKAVTDAVEYTIADYELRQAIWNVILNRPDDLLPKNRIVREVASLYIEQYTDSYALKKGEESGHYPLGLYRAKGAYADLFMQDTHFLTALAKFNQLVDQRRKMTIGKAAEMQKAAQFVYNNDYLNQIMELPEYKNTFEIGKKTIAELGCDD